MLCYYFNDPNLNMQWPMDLLNLLLLCLSRDLVWYCCTNTLGKMSYYYLLELIQLNIYNSSSLFIHIHGAKSLDLCSDVYFKSVFRPWKLKGKKKFKKKFSSHCLIWGKSKGKKIEEKYKKNLCCYEENCFLPNMRGKWRKKLFLVAC